MATSRLTVNVFDGRRQRLDLDVLYNISDGMGKPIVKQQVHPSGTAFALPFSNNLADNFSVVVSADDYSQAGFVPVKCSPDKPLALDLMLLKKGSTFNFAGAQWEALATADPVLSRILAHGAADDAAARNRYFQVMEDHPDSLACLFNITTAMAAIHLPVGNPLQYFKELIWDDTMKSDRFFAYADPVLHDQVKLAAEHGVFGLEAGSAIFHPGATDSYKQLQFGEANVQITFHADDTKVIDGITCLKVEPDIDYFKDPLAHALLEVISHGISGSLTDPRQVYMLRWIAGRHAGVPEFNPPYVIA